MPAQQRTLLHTIEGPKGKAEVFELESASGDSVVTEYEVSFGQRQERVPALGHAVILAEELTGRA
jgi:hypothetical protein